MATNPDDETGREDARLSPALIATLVAVPVAVIALFITFAAIKSSNRPDADPIPVESYSLAQGEGADQCPAFIKALPDTLGDFTDKSVDGTTVRWTQADSEPIVLRCGVTRPAELAPTSSLQVIDPVQWFMTDTIEDRGQVYVCVDHRPYIAMWIPVGAGNAPLTDVSNLIARTLTRAPLDFGK